MIVDTMLLNEIPNLNDSQSTCSAPIQVRQTAHVSLETEPVRLLRRSPGTAGPAPPPKRFPRTVWRGLVRKVIAIKWCE